MGVESDDDGEGLAQEADVRRIMRTPGKIAVDEHNATHAEYEAWCKHCAMGQAVSDHRRKRKLDRYRSKPVVSNDYAFLKSHDGDDRITDVKQKQNSPKTFLHQRQSFEQTSIWNR